MASLIFALMFTVAPAFAHSDCTHPRDVGEMARCDLPDCADAFFGIGQAPDYTKALTCLATNNSWLFVALIYFNGDGTPRDLPKAEAALTAWQRDEPGDFNSDQAGKLQAAIAKCKRGGPQSYRRIDYCADLAINTIDASTCEGIATAQAEAKLDQRIASVRRTLAPRDRARFDRLVHAFNTYELREESRGYAAMDFGSARGMGGLDQAAFARGHFAKLIDETIAKRDLKPADPARYRTADNEVGAIDRASIREFAAIMRDQERSYTTAYKQAARQSRRSWARFRDRYAQLARSLYQNSANLRDPVLAAKMAVTRYRIAELRHQPLDNDRPDPN